MRYRIRYNRRIIDRLGFEPEAMRRDARFGGEGFEEADEELLRELYDRNEWDRW